jgi:hypothetical protein
MNKFSLSRRSEREDMFTNPPQGGIMRTLQFIVTSLLLILMFVGCGGSKQPLQSASQGDVPDWYLNKPEDPN